MLSNCVKTLHQYWNNRLLLNVLLLGTLFLLTACDNQNSSSTNESTAIADAQSKVDLESLPEPSYIGGQHCNACHADEYHDWQNSHHDLAMQEVDATSVLGDFNNTKFQYSGVTTEFYRAKDEATGNDQFMIKTDGPDGAITSYPVAYVFGVYPLQQYLIAMPGGRLQSFSIAWDSRTVEQGGQRWFHLYPQEQVTHDDPLHWTNWTQNWNLMCAECHSTNLDKNYDRTTQTYDTRWAEIDVSCEACHGPASNHLLWADETQRQVYRFNADKGLTHRFLDRENAQWSLNQTSNQPQRTPARTTDTEIQVCAACHSRRSQLFEDDRHGQQLMQSFLPVTLEQGLYHSDGQANEEVYVYASFLQSKMYQAGVTCSDCHNPHSLELRAPGNGVCLQCHTAEYNTSQHHHHEMTEAISSKTMSSATISSTTAPSCVDCHMPSKNFMVVDARRDHSFRIPRPDLSATLNVPNTCNACHSQQSPQWAAEHINTWYGTPKPGNQDFAETFAAAANGDVNTKSSLQKFALDRSAPAIIRATAMHLLQNVADQTVVQTLAAGLQDRDPLVRTAAMRSLNGLPLQLRWQLAKPLLNDSVKVVRVIAAETLVDIPLEQLTGADQQLLANAQSEYLDAQYYNADTPQAQMNIGNFFTAQGIYSAAEEAYQHVVELDETWLPAYVNMADMYRSMGADERGEEVLQNALQRFPESADVLHSLGLLKIRQQKQDEGLRYLQRAAELAPSNMRYQYVYAVGLHSSGQTEQALALIDAVLQRRQDPSLVALKQQLQSDLSTNVQ